jgi:hypothetical protein
VLPQTNNNSETTLKMIALRPGARSWGDIATAAFFELPNKHTATNVRRSVVTGLPLPWIIAFWIVRERCRPCLIAKAFAEGCTTTETRFFSQNVAMPNERCQHAQRSGGMGQISEVS